MGRKIANAHRPGKKARGEWGERKVGGRGALRDRRAAYANGFKGNAKSAECPLKAIDDCGIYSLYWGRGRSEPRLYIFGCLFFISFVHHGFESPENTRPFSVLGIKSVTKTRAKHLNTAGQQFETKKRPYSPLLSVAMESLEKPVLLASSITSTTVPWFAFSSA